MKKIMLLMACLFIMVSLAMAQSRVTGVVIGADDNEPITGASVLVKGTKVGTITDVDGKFSLMSVPTSAKTLVISFIGMRSVEVPIKANLKIVLEADAKVLDEVMVVAYGTVKKSAFTGSATVLNGDKLKTPTASFDKGLSGQIAGVQVVSKSGQPGSGTSFRIRGAGSLSASNEPLIVIDGVATTNEEYSKVADNADSSSNLLASLNPTDIESITVLKDAAAAALYGSRAANGVVVITTKTGKAGKTKVTLDMKYTRTSMAGKYDMMSSSQYYKHLFTGYMNAGKDYLTANSLTQGQITHNPYNVDYPLDASGNVVDGAKIVVNTDWQKETFKPAGTVDYTASISGGTEKSTHFFSLGYLDQDGLSPNSSYKRYSGKANIQTQANSWLKVGLNSTFAYSIQNTTVAGSAGASPMMNSIQFPNAVPVYEVDSDGEYILDADGNRQFNYTNPVSKDFNPVATSYDDVHRSKIYRFMASAFAELKLYDGLTFKTVFSPDFIYEAEHRYWNKEHGNGVAYNGRLDKYQTTDLMYTSTNTLNYTQSFADVHHLNVMAGMEYWKSNYEYLYAGGQDLLGDMQELAAASDFFSSNSETTKEVLISYFGRAEYSYADKYNASFSLRTDGSSVFGDDTKWGTFWSAGLSWRLKQENFLKDVSWLDQLKVRLSYGTSGNKAGIDRYASKGLWTVDAGYKYNGSSGSILTQLANANLSWESQKMFNFGVDFGFLDRFYGSVDYFKKTSDGLLYDYPLSIENGLSSVTMNAAKTENSGFEFVLGANILKQGPVKWNVELNASIIKDKIKDLYGDDDVEQTDYSKIWSVGGSQYEFWMPTWAGVDSSDGSPLWYTVDSDGNRTTTSSYSEATYERQGRSTPTVYGGLSSNVSYKNFDLSVHFSYALGGKVYDGIYATVMHDGTTSGVNLHKDALNAWTTAGQVTNVPKYSINNANSSSSLSSRYLFDATNVRLKNVTLSYTLPTNLGHFSKIVNGCKVFASADNVFTLFKDDWKGYDDIDIFGVQGYSKYPAAATGRSCTFGVNFTF
ncbi:MAG: TonB-dependent receptor [Bacteroidetes bacterium]|nr:TonB-dependent receptor [Bacteroidota bacterium]